MMTKTIELSDDLAEKVKDIPDLDERILRFIRAEVVLHSLRQKRYSSEVLDLVREAHAAAEKMKQEGFDRAQVAEEIGEFIATLKS